MKILGIDSSASVASVAVIDDDRLLAEYTIDGKKTHSQTLLPMISALEEKTEEPLSTVDAIAIAKGPGSFTGLRIGSATAKGLALALDKPIIEVPTVDALAMNLWGITDVVCPIMDARRSQVYTGFYEFTADGELNVLHEQFAEDIVKVTQMLDEIGRPVVFLGDGVPVSKDLIAANIKVPYRFAPAHCARQRAAALAVLAGKYYEEGRTVSAADHKPEYLRVSQAERENVGIAKQ